MAFSENDFLFYFFFFSAFKGHFQPNELPFFYTNENIFTLTGNFLRLCPYFYHFFISFLFSFLGKGMIKVKPPAVWQAIRNHTTRHMYDKMLKVYSTGGFLRGSFYGLLHSLF